MNKTIFQEMAQMVQSEANTRLRLQGVVFVNEVCERLKDVMLDFNCSNFDIFNGTDV